VETGLLIQTSLGKLGWLGSASYEALRVALLNNIENILALPPDVLSLTIVNRRWRQQAYPGVTVLFAGTTANTATRVSAYSRRRWSTTTRRTEFSNSANKYSMPPINFIRNASCEALQDLPPSPPRRGSTNQSNLHEKTH
jgi:hypothetical protein